MVKYFIYTVATLFLLVNSVTAQTDGKIKQNNSELTKIQRDIKKLELDLSKQNENENGNEGYQGAHVVSPPIFYNLLSIVVFDFAGFVETAVVLVDLLHQFGRPHLVLSGPDCIYLFFAAYIFVEHRQRQTIDFGLELQQLPEKIIV